MRNTSGLLPGAALLAMLGFMPLPATAQTDTGAPAPSYHKGDTFIYDNGRVERFAGTDDKGLRWRYLSGREFVRDVSFFVPILKWRTSRSRGERILSGNPADMWPLTASQKVRFSIVSNSAVRKKDEKWDDVETRRSAQYWRCAAHEAKLVTVPAGEFEAYRIVCNRYSTNSMLRLWQRTWYYSPAVGHFIRLETDSFLTGKHTSYSLVAALPGDRATRKRIRAIVRAAKRDSATSN